MKSLTILIVLSLVSGFTFANEPETDKIELQGTFVFDKTSEIGALNINGEAAVALYNLLTVEAKEVKDPDDGMIRYFRKHGKNYVCTKDINNSFDCAFNIKDIKSGTAWSK